MTHDTGVPKRNGPRTANRSSGEATAGPASLLMVHGPDLGRRATVDQEPFELGRSPKASWTVEDASISARHARLTWDGAAHWIADLGSMNGTFVNDLRIKTQLLRDGDLVQLGRCFFQFMAGLNVEARFHETIYRLRTTDALTSARNRRYFDESLAREQARVERTGQPLALLLFDVDHVARLRARLGDVVADRFLRHVVHTTRPLLGLSDVIARVAAAEFGVISPETSGEAARQLGERMRVALAHATFGSDLEVYEALRPSLSVGVATWRAPMSALDLYARASAALRAAQRAGGDCVYCAESETAPGVFR
jgi:diguanylate cyclase (GGDEF)-like protein